MGGKEGGRGYLYQGIVAVLEALERPDWDRIYVEFPTEGDKVDIALRSAGEITDAIQVKSTANSFEKGDLSKWLSDIIADYPCQRYHLILIGNCAASAVGFINAVYKFQIGKLDAGAKKQLDGFETKSLVGIQINFKVLPFDPDSLKGLTREALWKYTYEAGHSLDPPHATLLVDAMIEEQLLQSTKNGYTDRTTFKQALDDQIKILIKRCTKIRREIGILCFPRGAEQVPKEIPILLDLREKFDGRFLKSGLNWNDDIGKSVQDFLRENTDPKQAYQLILDAHSSIAFVAGRVFDTKSGVDICPIQKTNAGSELWGIDKLDQTEYPGMHVEHIARDKGSFDSALVLNVSRYIYSDVVHYLKEQRIPIGRIINCTINGFSGTSFAIQNGTHAAKLTSIACDASRGRDNAEKRAYLHIFAAAPNAFMFYLGQVSRSFGRCILYEYDFELHDTCSYTPSIHFGGKGGLE